MKLINKSEVERLAINAELMFVPEQIASALSKQEIEHPQPVPYYRFLYHLSKLLKPELCLELGTNHGMAAACLALGNPDGKVITINNVQNEVYESCKLPNIDFWIQDSVSEPKYDLQNIDILFIDTSSKGKRNKLEYDFWINRVKPGGIVLIDDIFIVKDHLGVIKADKMADFWREFRPKGEKVELDLHGENGFGVILLNKKVKNAPHTKLKNIHLGDDIYVLGSGNSLDYIDRSFFQDKITIGINRIHGQFNVKYCVIKHFSFIQAAIDKGTTVIISKHNSGNNTESINDFNADYIFNHKLSRAPDDEKNFQNNINSLGKDEDIFVSFSTITSGIHLAAYMGAKNIMLCGHDCGYLDGAAYSKQENGFPDDLIKWHGNKENCIKYYNKWFNDVENQTLVLKKKLKEVYDCNIYSINPFINFGLEGHKYDTKKQ